MASGTIYISQVIDDPYSEAKIDWASTGDQYTRTSTVTAKLYIRFKKIPTGSTTGSWYSALMIEDDDGTNLASATGYQTLSLSTSWVLVKTITAREIPHAGNGEKSIKIYGSFSPSGESVYENDGGYIIKFVTLDKLTGASTISHASDVILGNSCSVRWNPYSATYRYKLTFRLGNWSYRTGVIYPNRTSSYTYTGYTIPIDVAEQITNAKTGKMTVTLTTYSNSSATTQVGSASSASFTVTVPSNTETNPSVAMSLTPVSSLGSDFSSLYIQGYSKVDANFSGSGKYGASINSYSMSVLGNAYSSPYTSGYLTTAGTVTVKGRATDSRGHYTDISENISVIPYSKPKIQAVSGETGVVVARCDENGHLTDSGTYLKIRAKRSYSRVESGGVQYNFCKIRYRYKVEGGTYEPWTDILSSDSLDSDEVSTGALLNGTLSVQASYTVQVEAIDDIGESARTTISIPTEKVYLHRAGSRGSLGFGEYVDEDDVVSIAKDKHVRLKSSINGVRMHGKALSGMAAFDIATHFADFTGSGSERQVFFVFGEANGKIVCGVAMVSDNGTTLWDGTTGVTLTTQSGGVLTVTLPAVANDIFTIFSSRDFSV